MRKTFDAELQELNYEMINMAAAAEDAIDVVTWPPATTRRPSPPWR